MPDEHAHEIPVSPAAWASWINVLIGIWIAASPWVLGHAGTSALVTDGTLVVGALIAIAGLYGALTWYTWPNWMNVVLGGWLIISPYISAFSTESALARGSSVASGIAVIIFALIAGLSKPQVLISE